MNVDGKIENPNGFVVDASEVQEETDLNFATDAEKSALSTLLLNNSIPKFWLPSITTIQNQSAYVVIGSIVAPNLPLGDYTLEVSYGWNHDSQNSDFIGRITQNGIQLGELHLQEPKDFAGTDPTGTTQRFYAHRRYQLIAISGTNTYNFEITNDPTNLAAESSVWEVLITLKKA